MTASARFMVMHSDSAKTRAAFANDFRSVAVIILILDFAPLLNFMPGHNLSVRSQALQRIIQADGDIA